MIDRCPICKARLKGATLCLRCGTDLALPTQIVRQAIKLQRRAIVALAKGHLKRARLHLKQVIFLKSTPLAQALLRFVRQRLETDNKVGNNEIDQGANEVPKVIVLGYEP